MRHRLDEEARSACAAFGAPASTEASAVLNGISADFQAFVLTDQSLINESKESMPSWTAAFLDLAETLGDSLLRFGLAYRTFARFVPTAAEGSKHAQAHAASAPQALAASLQIAAHLRLGKGEAANGNHAAPAAKAVLRLITAKYWTGGLPNVVEMLSGITDGATKALAFDAKSALQLFTQSRFRQRPAYRVVGTTGPDHARVFACEAKVANRSATARGPTKKAAEHAAAVELLRKLGAPSESLQPMRVDDAITLKGVLAVHERVGGGDDRLLEFLHRELGLGVERRAFASWAMTHSSHINEHAELKANPERRDRLHNGPLQFLGSYAARALVMASAFQSPAKWWQRGRGVFVPFFAMIHSNKRTAEVSRSLGLRRFAKLGKGEAQHGNSDEVEVGLLNAILGASVLSAPLVNLEQSLAWPIIEKLAEPLRRDGFVLDRSLTDHKTRLLELLQAFRLAPLYRVLNASGPEHEKRFTAEAVVIFPNGPRFSFPGQPAGSKRDAENAAAAFVLDFIDAMGRGIEELGKLVDLREPGGIEFARAIFDLVEAMLRRQPAASSLLANKRLLGFDELYAAPVVARAAAKRLAGVLAWCSPQRLETILTVIPTGRAAWSNAAFNELRKASTRIANALSSFALDSGDALGASGAYVDLLIAAGVGAAPPPPGGRQPAVAGLLETLKHLGLKGSTQQLIESLRWCRPAERLSRATVQLACDCVEVCLVVDAKVFTLREVLAKQAVRVLVAASLPRTVRVAEVHLHVGV